MDKQMDGWALVRQSRLVKIAKEMGFENAVEAWWDSASPEWPLQRIDEVAENNGVGEVCAIDLGVFLMARVYTVARWSDGCNGEKGGYVEYGHFDTEDAAKAWASVKRVMEEAK